jgi:hypothetical protein
MPNQKARQNQQSQENELHKDISEPAVKKQKYVPIALYLLLAKYKKIVHIYNSIKGWLDNDAATPNHVDRPNFFLEFSVIEIVSIYHTFMDYNRKKNICKSDILQK